MSQNKSLLRILVTLGFMFCVYIVFTAIVESIEASETTIHLGLDNEAEGSFTIVEETKFTLWLSEISFSDETSLDCLASADGVDKTTDIECDDFWYDSILFSLKLTDEEGNHYYFDDMGNTTLTSNNDKAIGKVTLPKGEYTLQVLDPGSYGYANVLKLQNSEIFSNIFKIVFGGIGAVFLFIIYFVLLALSKNQKRRAMYQSDEYYINNMNKLDQNQEIYDDEDPFSQYDKKENNHDYKRY